MRLGRLWLSVKCGLMKGEYIYVKSAVGCLTGAIEVLEVNKYGKEVF